MRLILILFLFAQLFSCRNTPQSIATLKLDAINAKWYGRYVASKDGKQVNLISSAAHGGFSHMDSLTIKVSTAKGSFVYLQIEQNGSILPNQYKIIGDTISKITLATKGKNTTWLYKSSEAHTGPLYIHALEAKDIQSIDKGHLTKIEFIGNSITCGAASDESNMPCNEGEYADHHNGYMSYASQTARNLNMDVVLSSISGAGIYRNWNSEGPTVPQLYEYMNLMDSSEGQWQATDYDPHIIVVALGTNDLSDGDGIKPRLPFDPNLCIENYVSFLQKIIAWHPKAQILLTDSPMVTTKSRDLQNCLHAVQKKVDSLTISQHKIQVFYYKPMMPNGCLGHPSVEDHTIMADQLTAFLKGKR